ncbi:hypothetical protein EDC01DRAFT_780824 [Geopyxis carbonaria]|nr:hypothetical protein EDC01DRAFT_780824 [Geopyxis carbonaria]
MAAPTPLRPDEIYVLDSGAGYLQYMVDIYHKRLMAQWRHLTHEDPPAGLPGPRIDGDTTLDVFATIVTNFKNHLEAGHFPGPVTKAKATTMIVNALRLIAAVTQEANHPLVHDVLAETQEATGKFYASVCELEGLLGVDDDGQLRPLWGLFEPKRRCCGRLADSTEKAINWS